MSKKQLYKFQRFGIIKIQDGCLYGFSIAHREVSKVKKSGSREFARLFRPSMRMYFFVLVLFVAAAVFFRQYLLAKLALWTWNGTNENAPAALSAQPEVTVTDNGNGTVTVSPAGTEKELLPVPAGIRVI